MLPIIDWHGGEMNADMKFGVKTVELLFITKRISPKLIAA